MGLGLLVLSWPALPAVALGEVAPADPQLASPALTDAPRPTDLPPPAGSNPVLAEPIRPLLARPSPTFSSGPASAGLLDWAELAAPAVWPQPQPGTQPGIRPGSWPGSWVRSWHIPQSGPLAQAIESAPGDGAIEVIPEVGDGLGNLEPDLDATAESLEAIPNAPQDVPLMPGLDTPTVLPEQDPTAPVPGGSDRQENAPTLPSQEEADFRPDGDSRPNGFEQDPSLEQLFPGAGLDLGEQEGDGSESHEDASNDDSNNEQERGLDPDLGVLRLRERPLATRQTQVAVPVYLVSNVSYTGNDNTLAGVDPVDDRFFRSSLALIASPRLSRRRALIGSVQGSLNRYNELSRVDYNELSLQLSLRQVLLPRVYGDLGWTNRNLYLDSDGDRFLREHAAFASLTRRDPLTPKTTLTSFYNLRVSFADPDSSSRLRNTLGSSLRYDITPRWQTSLTGRLTLTNFTQQARQDFYGQALAQLSYKLAPNARISLFGSLIRGNSSSRRVDFDSSTLGLSFNANLQLF